MAGGSNRKGSKGMAGGSNRKRSKGSANGGVGEGGSSKEVLGEDSGVNVASTLMEMKQSAGGEGPGQEVSGRSSYEGGQDGETVGDASLVFSVGDFVWGKVTNHLWWPGRVYDPSNASDHANKVKQGDKTLVAYFGDGTFAWCNPSQLKPLEEDFVEMSKQSGSRNFVSAVDGLLDEVSKLVVFKLLSARVPADNLTGLGRTVAVNAGIKEEVLVPEGGLEKFPARFFKPSHCLSRLKSYALLSEVDNMLEFTVLKSWLSVFYRAKGGRQLPAYHDPQPIPGLDDGKVSSNNSGGEGENGTPGPAEDDTLSPPVIPESEQNMQGVLQKCQEAPGERIYQKRKQRSIAEIIGISTDAKTENMEDTVAKEEITTSGRKTLKVERGKRKDGGDGGDAKGKDDVSDSAKRSSSARKKKKVGGEDDSEKKKKAVDGPESGASNSGASNSGASVSRKSKRKSTDGGVDVESSLSSELKRKKAAKLPELADIAISSIVKDGSRVQNSHSKKKSKKVTSGTEIEGSTEKKGRSMGSSQKERSANELASERRDRKKSKYLCFPYVSAKKEQKKEEMDAESVKISSEVQPGKRMTRSASKLSLSPVGKSRDGTPNTKTAKEHGQNDHEASASGPRKTKQDANKVSDPLNVKAPAVELLSRLRSAARNPLRVEGDNSIDKKQAGKRRMSEKSSPAVSIKEQDFVESSSPNDKSLQSKPRKTKDAKSDDKSKEKEVADADTTDEDRAVLLISFNPASMLPTKDDLIKTYEKYGALRLEGADTYDPKRCARIVFSKNSEAEEAFNDSQIVSPFPTSKATFRLQYLSSQTKTRELKEISGANSSQANKLGDPPTKPSAPESTKLSASEMSELGYIKEKLVGIAAMLEKPDGKPTAPESTKLPASEMSELGYIKEKLVGIAAVLEKPDGKISKNVKSKLRSEINDVLEKVSAMVGPSP